VQLVGHHDPGAPITLGVSLIPRNQSEIDRLLQDLYDPAKPQYHQFLRSGEFDARFGPTSDQLAAVKSFLAQSGLHVTTGGPDALVLDLTGTSGQAETTFRTRINDYQLPDGMQVFANSTNVQIPFALSSTIQAVLGLNDIPVVATAAHHTFTTPPARGAS